MNLKVGALGIVVCVVAMGTNDTVRAAAAGADEVKLVGAATIVLNEMMRAGDKAIPGAILEQAEAIAIFPGVKKAGLVIGKQWGHGIVSVRDRDARTWSSPTFLAITGGSLGAQIGGTETDLILVVMNRSGVEHLLSNNQVTLGADLSATAGPVSSAHEASTDLQTHAAIFSYSRSRGLFAGVAVNGSVIKQDAEANARFYEQALSPEEIVLGRAEHAPASVAVLQTSLTRHGK